VNGLAGVQPVEGLRQEGQELEAEAALQTGRRKKRVLQKIIFPPNKYFFLVV
jgi:hypothetical protein